MRPEFVTPQRAERFNAVLEGSFGNAPLSVQDTEALRLVRALGATAAATSVEPDPLFVGSLRERLMAQADQELLAASGPKRRAEKREPIRSPHERRFAAGVAALALVGATASMGVAAQTSLPGETLYPLKRALENTQTGLLRDETSKGRSLLADASDRLSEIEELSRAGAFDDPAVISGTLETFSEQSVEAATLMLAAYNDSGHASLIHEVRVFTAKSLGTLRQLEPLVPRESRA